MARTALITDIHGYIDAFEHALVDLGVDLATDEPQIPAGLTIINMGDLVHAGPCSAQCVDLADRLLRANPERYIQLWGNHDVHYVGGPDVSARSVYRDAGEQTRAILRRWLDEGLVHLAATVKRSGQDAALVTHGGLTSGLWRELGSPQAAPEAAQALNALLQEADEAGVPQRAFRPGWLMTGVYDMAAGVLGPRTGAELAKSWLDEQERLDPNEDPRLAQMPFDQIHGHEGVWWWPTEAFHDDDVPTNVKVRSGVDHWRRCSWVHIGQRTLLSIDPKLTSEWRTTAWKPAVF